MAVLCPSLDPYGGWYITVHHKNGTKTNKRIVSPLWYYHEMGVKPPVGAKFSQQEHADFAADMAAPPGELDLLLSLSAPTFSQAPQMSPILNSSPAVALGVPQLNDYSYELEDQLLLPPVGLPSMNSPLYNPSTSSTDAYSQLSAVMKATMGELKGYMSSLYGSENGFGSPSSFSPYADPFAFPKAKLTIGSYLPPLSHTSSMPMILHLPTSSGLKSKHSSMPPSSSSMPYPSQSLMSSSSMNKYANVLQAFKPYSSQTPKSSSSMNKYSNAQAFMPYPSQSSSGYKYNNLKSSSTSNVHQFSASSSSTYNYSSMNPMSSFSPMQNASQPLKPSGSEPSSYYKGSPSPFSPPSTSYENWFSLPSTSSGTGQKLPPIGTPSSKASSTTSSASVNENQLPPPKYEHPNVANDMNIDELDEDDFDEDDIVDEMVDDETLNKDYKMYVDDEEEE